MFFSFYRKFIKRIKIVLLQPSEAYFASFRHNCERIIISIIYHKIWKKFYDKKIIKKWVKGGKAPPPPDYFKQIIVKAYAKRYLIDIFIETGTYRGDMILATRKIFKKIYSIELDSILYKNAKEICSKYNHISLFQGDSGDILPKILFDINQSCLFWLDAHYFGKGTGRGKLETPIMMELISILRHSNQNHIILIDDAHAFTGENDYPTLEELKKFVFSKKPNWAFIVKENVIRIHKKFR